MYFCNFVFILFVVSSVGLFCVHVYSSVFSVCQFLYFAGDCDYLLYIAVDWGDRRGGGGESGESLLSSQWGATLLSHSILDGSFLCFLYFCILSYFVMRYSFVSSATFL